MSESKRSSDSFREKEKHFGINASEFGEIKDWTGKKDDYPFPGCSF